MVEIKEIINWLEKEKFKVVIKGEIRGDLIIERPEISENAEKHNIAFTKTETNSKAGIIFCSPKQKCKNALIKVETSNPRLNFIKCLSFFFKPGICKIFKGENVKIGANCSLGGDGFGYEKDENGNWIKFPHFGHIIIEDNVEISNNVCIDRGVIGNTIIQKGTKIDNLVHVAHNVIVGANTLIIAKSMIGGSATIGENCWIGPSSSIINGISIGNNVTVGIGSNVIKDVPDNIVVAGNPAKIIRNK